jgi:hypothetical protein
MTSQILALREHLIPERTTRVVSPSHVTPPRRLPEVASWMGRSDSGGCREAAHAQGCDDLADVVAYANTQRGHSLFDVVPADRVTVTSNTAYLLPQVSFSGLASDAALERALEAQRGPPRK